MHDNFRIFRRLIGRVDSRKLADLPGPRLLVKLFRITRFAHFQRGIDEHFDELRMAFEGNFTRAPPIHLVGRDERRHHDHSRVRHQPRHFAHAADIFEAVLRRKPQVGIQPVTHVIAIEHVRVNATAEKIPFQGLRDG